MARTPRAKQRSTTQRNAWAVRLDEQDRLVWINDEQRIYHPPADSTFQRLEDWFIGLLPIDEQM